MPASPRILASAILSLVLISATDSILGQQPATDSKTVLVRITAVDDKGRPISGLKQEQFSGFEKKDQLQITSFDSNDEPASIAFVFDVSGSIPAALKSLAAELAYQFTETSHRSNNYVVIAFDRQAQLICGWDCRADDLKKAFAEVVRIVPQMNTALYDACDLALTKLQSSKYGRRVIIVVSDGEDNASKLSFPKLRDRIRDSSVAIYSIGMTGGSDLGSSLGMEGQGILDELASISGGRAYFPRDAKELHDVVDSVARDLSHQYTIGFVVQATHDNKWHSMKIKVAAPKEEPRGKFPHVFLRYREGYFDR